MKTGFFYKQIWLQLGHSTMASKENDNKKNKNNRADLLPWLHLNYKIVSHKLNPSVQH
jgi:hypothetical protein